MCNSYEASYVNTPPDMGEEYYCPCCGKECLEIFTDEFDSIVGCENCIKHYEAWEKLEQERDEYHEFY